LIVHVSILYDCGGAAGFVGRRRTRAAKAAGSLFRLMLRRNNVDFAAFVIG
jgi:hypothetical protein